MKKGSITKAIWTIIEIVMIIVAIVIIAKLAGIIGDWSEARATSASAAMLSEAIEKVCKDHTHEETVEIWMPQSDVSSWKRTIGRSILIWSKLIGTGVDPKWVIYYGDGISSKYIVSRVGGEALDLVQLITEAGGWDSFIRECPTEDRTICYGFFERDLQPKYSNLKIPSDCNVDKFWILSPCYANVTVYYDQSKGKVTFCYKTWIDPNNKKNYCHGKVNEAGSIFDNLDSLFGNSLSQITKLLGADIVKTVSYTHLTLPTKA